MGGAVGHLQHLYDNYNLTLGEIKKILESAANGRLQNSSEKLDGLNLVFTWNLEENDLRVARAAGDIKRGGLTSEGLANKFAGRENLHAAFTTAFKILKGAISTLSEQTLEKVFGQAGNRWCSIEVIYTKNPNVVNYDNNNIVFHEWPVFEIENGSVNLVEDKSISSLLTKNIERMKKSSALNGWQIMGPAVLNLTKIHDGSILENAIKRIDDAAIAAQVDDNATLKQYMGALLEDEVKQFNLPKKVSRMLIARCLKEENAPSLVDIRKNCDNSKHDLVTEFVKNSPALLKMYVRPIEFAINDFAVDLLRGLKSTLISDNDAEVARLREEVANVISKIEKVGDPKAMSVLSEQMHRLRSISNITTPVEGVVFFWKGDAYKFTGSFSSLNQILGLFRYRMPAAVEHF
jgi:hypothetical protein